MRRRSSYLEYDWCNADGLKAPEACAKMSAALREAGRPILFSLCECRQF